MRKILYYDCFSGISGDMNLGALIDLGVDKEYLLKELAKLNINDEFEIKINKDSRKGISGTKVDVILKNLHEHNHEHEHSHDYVHSRGHEHEHNHEHSHEHEHNHAHDHRNVININKIIDNSNLNDNVKKISKEIFLEVAKAEGKVHNKPLEEVHFHEVGATDSIVDIVGAAICLDYLKVDKVLCSKVQVGSGFVKCAHGTMPVPAPATAEILKDIPMVSSEEIPFEATTPTGAAIVVSTVYKFTQNKNFYIEKVGYGIGGKDLSDIPNVLRVFLAEVKEQEENDIEKEEALILECNIDDMNSEIYEYVINKLLHEGASDAYITPIIMKKTRPAAKLTVLCENKLENIMREIIFKETTTLGIRKYSVEKSMLKRKIEKVKTIYGEISVKKSYLKGQVLNSKPEYEDCKKIALENNIPIKEVYEAVNERKE
ncbi:nickel pincer cofactor biosynthesis protein LarC [Clostridium botulinum]|uniref:Pyridinium-3,5-bisthiocarboxylic acid mononucleotide nickel insertion protein n=1 Tax=Clostridium botulinum TaxID=1491 RepID=A0A6G4HUJ3_CLOBO|nr:nickel pincer cofactor biosynthesis protein LarC [Clostridium botulinum]MBD5588492.1 nickel pincer cofactor biosynthesis protein LarC [Clostridium botulinum]MBO0570694.1 nickel pincer cofactor biosynthesis protein LarC [Clostridium botulinum]MBO0581258.1 nickel pincer cofactor biosynthesis protein LarC [Clostridium botulinum]NFJ62081.1 nickel pincer cofactor biosynthesis protein LarC [Clostridium botulinum]NFJ69452.1 nickel pincer cofactor biosynthesis protein LarC [Clostridium botulinum]